MKHRAFTLLEVTLATAIFGTALVVLTSAFSNALGAMRERREEANLEPIVRFLRSRIITIPDPEQFKMGQELYLPDGDKAIWSAELEPCAIADLFRVTLRIEITSNEEARSTLREETLYLLRPTWSDSDERSDIIEDAKRDLETRKRSLAQ